MPKSNTVSEYDELKTFFNRELKEINSKLDLIIKHISNDSKTVPKDSVKKTSNISINKFPDRLEITGQTFDIKDLLKQNKAIWDKSKKSWNIIYSDNNWFNKFKKSLEQHCSNIKVINKSETKVNQDTISNSSDDIENQVFEFLDDD